MENQTTVKAYIMFSGNDDFELEAITQALQTLPTNSWKVGQRMKADHAINKFTYPYTAWCYEPNLDASAPLETWLVALKDVFEQHTDLLNHLIETYNLDVQIEVVSHIINGEAPKFIITPEISRFLASIHAYLDFDIYTHAYSPQT